MNLAIGIEGKTYLPVAAVPYITRGKVTDQRLIAALIAATYGMEAAAVADLVAYRLLPLGGIQMAVRVGRDELIAIADEHYLRGRPPLEKTAAMLVAEESLRAQMRVPAFLTVQDAPADDLELALDLEPTLPWDVATQLWVRLPLRPNLNVARTNGREAVADRIDAAMDDALESLSAAGIVLDRGNLPGRKVDWQRVLQARDAKTTMALATLARYFKELGIRFRKGAKGKDAVQILKHFGLSS
ncbi:MAG: hypothetical protein U1F10_05525 [Burkholderiales bacterium]